MKFCIAMMCQNESSWLTLHLPVLLKSSAVDGCIIVDGGSTDESVAVAESLGATVFHRQWDWKPLDQENYLIECCEREGYDAMLFTAPDELWFPKHIDRMKEYLGRNPSAVLQFPTFNFVKDRLHFAPDPPYYPDLHQRAWVLGKGVRHMGVLDSVPAVNPDNIYLFGAALFHYVHIKDRRFYHWKHLNFHAVKEGRPALDVAWEDVPPVPYPNFVPFYGSQPLDPEIVGRCAPYTCEGE